MARISKLHDSDFGNWQHCEQREISGYHRCVAEGSSLLDCYTFTLFK
jgi:hypothetical protein